MKRILITGGTGYIGSHLCVTLAATGHQIFLLDNLCNSNEKILQQLEFIIGQRPPFLQADVRDSETVYTFLQQENIDAVIHLAGLKSIREASEYPQHYYENNIYGTLSLLFAMQKAGTHCLVFSSSASVYGESSTPPLDEDCPLSPTNAYARSKRCVEEILHDVHATDADWKIACLRYFNPAGAHGMIGELATAHSHNLFPRIAAAVSDSVPMEIYGNDYPTKDGTCIRDYIHIQDLAEGHLAVLRYLDGQNSAASGDMLIVNLGTGCGYSVLEVIQCYEDVIQRPISYTFQPRRNGDVAELWTDPSRAQRLLNWHAKQDLSTMCKDSWEWQQRYIALQSSGRI